MGYALCRCSCTCSIGIIKRTAIGSKRNCDCLRCPYCIECGSRRKLVTLELMVGSIYYVISGRCGVPTHEGIACIRICVVITNLIGGVISNRNCSVTCGTRTTCNRSGCTLHAVKSESICIRSPVYVENYFSFGILISCKVYTVDLCYITGSACLCKLKCGIYLTCIACSCRNGNILI